MTDSGHVRIYKNVNNTWTQVGSDIDGEASESHSRTTISHTAEGSKNHNRAYKN